MAGEWDQVVQDWLITPGACIAGGLANKADCNFYAAAPIEGEKGWGIIYKDPHEEDMLQEDGVTTKKVMITESAQLLKAVTEGRVSGGIWIGGVNFKCVQNEMEMEVGEGKCTWVFVATNDMDRTGKNVKGGAHIMATDTTVVLGVYSEGEGQSSGNCKSAVTAMAEYLLGAGY